ncbi:unnamed protein product, partial [Onchocerca ochengi]|uniref:Uncharacterized protein n=1 Tax=Onchocerca ochengi TaxID=42157 RepID=A0A182ERK0_ONCOC
MLTLIDPEKLETNIDNDNNKIINFDNLFFGHPIPKYPIDKKPPTKGIQIPMRLKQFIPHSFTGAILYVGSLFEKNCLEGVTYLIFDTPIVIKPGLQLTRFYSKNINLTRPIQDDRSAKYYMSSNIEFLERGKELCPRAKTSISDTDSKEVNL